MQSSTVVYVVVHMYRAGEGLNLPPSAAESVSRRHTLPFSCDDYTTHFVKMQEFFVDMVSWKWYTCDIKKTAAFDLAAWSYFVDTKRLKKLRRFVLLISAL